MIRLLAVALLTLSLGVAHASAQTASKIFVSSTGSDANDGGRLTPKRSFQAAHDAVAPGGGIVVLDTAGYGPLTITKSVTISVPPGVSGFSTVAGNINAITVNAGAGDTVALRGLNIEGDGTGDANFGIVVRSGTNIIIEDCTVRGFAVDIAAVPSMPTNITIRGGSIRDAGRGIYVQNLQANAVSMVVADVSVDNVHGPALAARTIGTTAPVSILARHTAVANSVTAVESRGDGSQIVSDDCAFIGNTTVFNTIASGALGTRGNNTFLNNASLGITPTPIPGG